MTKTANEKQAIYINRLSYKLYKLNDCKDTKTIIPYKKALQLTYDVADDMIKTLLEKIKEVEIDKYLKTEIEKDTDLNKLIDFPTLSIIENYKKIDSFRIDINKETAEINTLDGDTYKLSGDILRKHNFSMDYKELASILKRAIDYDLRVSIIKTDKFIVVTPENEVRKSVKENYERLINLYNRILEETNNKLPVDKNGKITAKSFNVTLKYIRKRDLGLYEELKKEGKSNFKGLITLLEKERVHEYNIVSSNRKILIG